MPSLQVVDFGPDSFSESMGKFAQGFSDSFFKQQTQKRNEDLFTRIKNKYGPDAKPEQIMRDIIEAEGFDQDYKKDLISNVKEYANLATQEKRNLFQDEMLDIKREELKIKKEGGEKPITPFQKEDLKLKKVRLENEAKRIEIADSSNDKKLPTLIADYTNKILKDSEDKMSEGDKGILNERIQNNMQDDEMTLSQAFNEALDYVSLKNDLIDKSQLEPKPEGWTRFDAPSNQDISKAMEKAYEGLENLYEAGVESQRDLRFVAKKAGWSPEEITKMLQRVFQRRGKKIRSTTKQVEEQEEAQSLDDVMAEE
jgi:hypothetical protein